MTTNNTSITKPVHILAFDPGLTTAGWSYNDYDPTTGLFTINKHDTFSAAKLNKDYKANIEKYGKRLISLTHLENITRDLITKINPDYIVTEDAFFNRLRPNAYGALLLWINTLERVLFNDFNKVLYKIPTRSAKLCITGTGGSGKTSVKDAIFTCNDIQFKPKRNGAIADHTCMSSHEADSIAVGYFFAKNIYNTLV